MKFLLQLIFLLLSIVFTFSACEEDKPAPISSIKARVSPAEAAKSMSVTLISVPETFMPDDSGVFLAHNLTAKSYWVTFEPNAGYQKVELGRVQLEPGTTIDLGTIVIPKAVVIDNYYGTFSATLNNSSWQSDYHGAIRKDSSLTIWSTGNRAGLINSYESMGLFLKNVTGPGIYTNLSYAGVPFNNSNSGNFLWSSAQPGGSCSINITKLDTLQNRVSGEFTFHALPVPGSGVSNVRTATKGTFTDLKIQ